MEQKKSLSDQVTVSTGTIVIGAGPAGLAVGACLRRADVPFVILERADCIGSAWHHHYDRLHLHTAKGHSALPYSPFPADFPTYPSRMQVISYLEAYARQFQLEPRYRQRVISVRRNDGDGQSGWQVRTDDSLYTARAVVVATGMNAQPVVPTWPDQEKFKGVITHTADYKNGDSFREKRVLVVGFGNSGAEIAIDLCEHGAQVGMSVRGPVNVIFRDTFGLPAQSISILMRGLPGPVVDTLTAPLIRLRFGDLSQYGLRKASYGAVTQIRTYAKIPVIDVGTIKLIKEGKIKVYPGIDKFEEDGVTFADGTRYPFDAVILGTGFRTGLEAFLDNSDLPPQGQTSSTPGLYFCGFKPSATGLLREISLEAPRIAQAIKETNIQPR